MFNNILLVAPPSSSYLGAVRPPAGLGYLAQALHDSGISCYVEDMRTSKNETPLFHRIRTIKPDLVGVSMVSYEYKRSYSLVRNIKASFPDVSIIVGGAHVSVMGEVVLSECEAVDYAIMHEGERPLVQLCRGEVPEGQIPGLLYRQDGSILSGPQPEPVKDLDALSFPRYAQFDLRRYAKEINIVTSRGCPYRCIFCPNSLTAKIFRCRSARNVVDELEYWYARGIRQFNINDDNFTLKKSRVYQICDEIEQRDMVNLFIRCANGIRADRVDRELLARMKDVGFREVAFGADGGNNRVLEHIVHKGETLDDIENALQDACDLGLKVKLFIIVGHPGETMEDIEDSIALAQRYPVVWVHLNNPIPYPGTELFDIVKKNNYFVIQPEVYLNNVTEVADMPVFETPELSLEARRQILERCRKIEKQVKQRAVRNMFAKLPLLGTVAGWIFASRLGQWLFFHNILSRSLINRIWYRKMVFG